MREQGVVEILVTALKEEDVMVRENAEGALMALGGPIPQAVPTLIETLKKDSNAYVRGRAAVALGCLGDPQAISSLIEALKEDKNAYVRFSAEDALKYLGGPEAATFIRELKNGKDTKMRSVAEESLKTSGYSHAAEGGQRRDYRCTHLKRNGLEVPAEYRSHSVSH
jgi:HEAT repeat protein